MQKEMRNLYDFFAAIQPDLNKVEKTVKINIFVAEFSSGLHQLYRFKFLVHCFVLTPLLSLGLACLYSEVQILYHFRKSCCFTSFTRVWVKFEIITYGNGCNDTTRLIEMARITHV